MLNRKGNLWVPSFDGNGAAFGFSTRLGGVSADPATAEMNLAFGREDPDGVVLSNIGIFARALTGGLYGAENVVCAPQIHSATVRYVTEADRGSGVTDRGGAAPCDGFVTDRRGVILTVRVADCAPILFRAEREDGGILVAAVHAGWRGTVSGIAAAAAEKLASLGAVKKSVRAAIGPHIGPCCFEVREDFRDAVAVERGRAFAERHIASRDGSLFADLTGMNTEILSEADVSPERIEVSTECTACRPDLYHSHRRTGGKRGAMGAAAVIL